MGRPKFIPKSAPSPSTITTPSNTAIPRPTPLTIPNGIRIHSAVLPQYTFQTDRQTDRWSMRETCTNSAYALIGSDALKRHQTALEYYIISLLGCGFVYKIILFHAFRRQSAAYIGYVGSGKIWVHAWLHHEIFQNYWRCYLSVVDFFAFKWRLEILARYTWLQSVLIVAGWLKGVDRHMCFLTRSIHTERTLYVSHVHVAYNHNFITDFSNPLPVKLRRPLRDTEDRKQVGNRRVGDRVMMAVIEIVCNWETGHEWQTWPVAWIYWNSGGLLADPERLVSRDPRGRGWMWRVLPTLHRERTRNFFLIFTRNGVFWWIRSGIFVPVLDIKMF